MVLVRLTVAVFALLAQVAVVQRACEAHAVQDGRLAGEHALEGLVEVVDVC